MKHTLIILGLSVFAFSSCKEQGARYIDPDTGQTLSLVKDANTGLMVDAETKKPVYIYVDSQKKDTILGSTGEVINGRIVVEDGKYKYRDYKAKVDDDAYKIKDGDYKKKVEGDGDIKIKTDDKKIKIDGETGEKKVKRD
jgi:hypothetical protein